MTKSFDDFYEERKQRTKHGLFSLMLSILVGTAIELCRERLQLILERDTMQNILTNLRIPAIISFLLVLPFMIMELVNRRNFNIDFPLPLFIFMWLLPVLFILTGMPIVRNLRSGNGLLVNPIFLLVRVILLALLAWMWFGVLIDQMPCFLGVPNCD